MSLGIHFSINALILGLVKKNCQRIELNDALQKNSLYELMWLWIQLLVTIFYILSNL